MKENKNKKQIFVVTHITVVAVLAVFLLTSGPNVTEAVSMSVAQEELDDLQGDIKAKQKQIEDLKKQKEIYERSLNRTRQQISSLKNQLTNIDQVMAKVALEVETIKLEEEEVALQVKNINLTMEQLTNDLDVQEDKIAEILRVLNRNGYQSKVVQVLATNKSIGDFFANISQLNEINGQLSLTLEQLTDKKGELDRQQNLLLQKKDQLEQLEVKLTANKEKLSGEKVVKDQILSKSKGEESNYATLLKQLQDEQKKINNEIYSLEIQARKKLLELQGDKFLASEKGFIWPVPSRKVTAYFHDPDYPYRNVFEHPAIDIGSTPQGTPVRAVKSGYVAKVKDTGKSGGYNYIMLVHSDGLSSVYGHLNRMVIAEDTFVVQGEIIGYSGGTPGTAGAGNLTTGPHLHLEIRQGGIPVNPLNYLP
ncbi:MAG: peptidoglycan DD-metalloendopeptidase family protein [Candidatus Komeilibacteria bacterium]|nr:peptidoglycan DD-metalloendopeptidase family protein [Candidatus Komeilibacteria bacterium]